MYKKGSVGYIWVELPCWNIIINLENPCCAMDSFMIRAQVMSGGIQFGHNNLLQHL